MMCTYIRNCINAGIYIRNCITAGIYIEVFLHPDYPEHVDDLLLQRVITAVHERRLGEAGIRFMSRKPQAMRLLTWERKFR